MNEAYLHLDNLKIMWILILTVFIVDGKSCKKINKLQGMGDHFMYLFLEPIFIDWLFFYLILKFYMTVSVSINQEWLCFGWKFLLGIDENCDKIIYMCSTII